jgi:hypothetical protein
MMHQAHRNEAAKIASDSYMLQNWEYLPHNASARRQVEALKADQEWQRKHHDEVSARIDRLIRDIEDGSNVALKSADEGGVS